MVLSRLLAVLILIATVLVGASAPAYACSCSRLSPAEAVKHADTVFTGTVAWGSGEGEVPVGRPVIYTFRADNVYKGAPAAEFRLVSSADTAACGYPFATGGRYLVFASSGDSGMFEQPEEVGLSTTLCSGNVPVEPGEGPLRPGDERATGHESLGGPIDSEMIAALGAPVRLVMSERTREVPAPVAEDDAGWGRFAAGAAALVLLVAAGVLIARGRRLR
ncbi:hypothetical protein AB0I81_04465 [Nonomuraea sp. NPDC050404]|uniref:hypothetical protein n=1 Tax=Nonomuraea sp. NPDC050404 TaxID=3155783 RepID=UPI003409208B